MIMIVSSYDSETGLYYMQTRYYDPEVKRFINADCDNNPILYQDKDGRSAIIGYAIWSGLMGAASNALAGVLSHSYDDMTAGQIAVDVAT